MTGLRSKDHSTRRTYDVGKMENEEKVSYRERI
jgi:hypothetical protein